ncbi:MAG TPA: calcium-binding protein [Solirubrobacteraceae bacterium]
MTSLRLIALLAAALVLAVAVPAAPAATVQSDGTTATFTPDAGQRDDLSLKSEAGGKVRFDVENDTIAEGAGCTEVDADSTVCNAIARVVVNLADGDDTARGFELTAQALTATGGAGNDRIYGGAKDDDLRGGDGNDNLSGISEGGAGIDRLDGGAEDDTIIMGAEGDEVLGGPGADRVTVILADTGTINFPPANLSITLDDAANDALPGAGANVHSDVEHIGTYMTDLYENGVSWSWSDDGFIVDGELTARATDGPNSVWGGSAGDDLDPLGGNDVVSAGKGDDTVSTVDGYADRVACGPGTDTVAGDTLDDISDSCETVTRTDVGNANDVPEVPEDAPPSITLTDAAPGTATAAAADDRGIATVLFLDDDRLVCADDAAPFTCEHRPGAEDVGRNTLTAIAVDTAQQTASDRRLVVVPRFAPADVTLRVSRRRVGGRVVLPAEVAAAVGCRGEVVVSVKRGARTVTRRAQLKRDCTYAARIRTRRGAAKVRATFAGNDVLAAKPSAVRLVR